MIEQKFGFITFALAIGGLMLLGWLLSARKKPVVVAESTKQLEGTPA